MKISKIMEQLSSSSHKKQWFQAGLYILNKHWDKVDNFRIDKFLALLRHLFAQALLFLKETAYEDETMAWLQEQLNKLFGDSLSA